MSARRRRDRTALIAGSMFILLGVLFLLDRVALIDLEPAIVVPVLLIAVGIGMLLGGGREAHDADLPPPAES